MKRGVKNKAGKGSRPDHGLSLSIVICLPEDPAGATPVLESVAKIRKPFEKDFEVIFCTGQVAPLTEMIRASEVLRPYLDKGSVRIMEAAGTETGASFIDPVREAKKEHVLVILSEGLEKSFNLEEFFHIDQETLKGKGWVDVSFIGDEAGTNRGPRGPVFFCNRELAEYCSEIGWGSDPMADLSFLMKQLPLESGQCRISQASPAKAPEPDRESSPAARRPGIRRRVEWTVTIPLREVKTAPHHRYSFLHDASVYRLLFAAVATILFFLMPLMSRQAGISGDEVKHYRHAEKVYEYFASGGADQRALSDPQHKLNYYGQSFDLLTYLVNKFLHSGDPYTVRHMLIAIAGFLIILVCGLLATTLNGYRAGLITMVLMFFAPRFLGHSFNNPLDIPFALGYIFSIYQMILFLGKLPEFSKRHAFWLTIGIAFTISIRIGGLMLIPYAFAFSGLYLLVRRWDFKLFSRDYLRFAWKGLVYLLVVSAAAYGLSLLPWPYGLQKPFKNPFEALGMMSNITVSIRVLFDGNIHWSNMLPWYYIEKNIFYTVPVVLLLGFFLNAFLYRLYRRRFPAVYSFFLYFAVLFPLAYVIYKNSNVYGGWRHLLFVFPPMAVLSAISFDTLIASFRKPALKYAVAGILLLGILHPARFILANHPFEYMYFNEIMGGTNAAYGRFETDYYLNSLRQGSEWLITNVLDDIPADPSPKVIVASNADIDYYFRNQRDKVTTRYTRYYERGASNWDYGVYFCNYISPDQLRNNLWPPFNTIHTIRVDSVPVCAVVKRGSKEDYRAIRMVDSGNYSGGIPLLEEVAREEPHNEIALLKLSEACLNTGNYDRALSAANRCLEVYPHYDKALNLVGIAYMNMGETDRAITTFIRITRINYRFVSAYHNLGLIYATRKGDLETAKSYFMKAIEVNRNFKPAYQLLSQIYAEQGNQAEARRYLEMANRL